MAKKKAAAKKKAVAKKSEADVESAVQEAMELVDQLGEPNNMSKQAYRSLLQGVRFECDVRIEAVNDELGEDSDDEDEEDEDGGED